MYQRRSGFRYVPMVREVTNTGCPHCSRRPGLRYHAYPRDRGVIFFPGPTGPRFLFLRCEIPILFFLRLVKPGRTLLSPQTTIPSSLHLLPKGYASLTSHRIDRFLARQKIAGTALRISGMSHLPLTRTSIHSCLSNLSKPQVFLPLLDGLLNA